jgi:FolB domain-containing protein
LSFDFYVKLKISKNLTNDDINQVLNYEYLVKTLDSVISNNRFFLLETLAERLMKDILIPENVTAASIFISKLDILESGKIGYSMTRIK